MSAADSRHAVVIEEFTALRKNSLRGFAKIRLPSGMILHDVAIHAGGDNKAWASPPSKPMLNREGNMLRDADTKIRKIRYVQMISFASKELRDRFSELMVEAVREAHPDALT